MPSPTESGLGLGDKIELALPASCEFTIERMDMKIGIFTRVERVPIRG